MAKPKLCLIPATIGDKVYSILPSDGVGDFDFTRADGSSPTGVTRINAQGLIEEVASGENRLNYSLLDGEVVGCPHLLLEPSRTNLITYSEDFTNASWTKLNSTITSNDIISPDGNVNADKIESTSTSSSIVFVSYPAITLTNTYTAFAFIKKGDNRWIRLGHNTSAIGGAWFDLDNGVTGTVNCDSAKIEELSNGWYKCSITFIASVSSGSSVFFIGLSDADNSTNAGTVGKFYYIFGSQLEQGSFPTSYIKTDGSAVTRAAETCNGSGDAATFNDSEGVLMAEISALANDGTNRQISINNNGTSNRVYLEYSSVNNRIRGIVENSGGNQAILSAIVNDVKNYTKVAIKYKQNDFSLFINGFEVDTELNGGVLVGLSELSFDRGDGLSDFYGKTKQIQYFDTTDIDLEQLTSWDSFRAMAEGQLYSVE